MRNKFAGSTFDSFLKEEGLESEVAARATKRTFSHQLEEKMQEKNKKKIHLRRALGSPTTTERLFSEHTGISLETMVKAANIVGCDLQIQFIERVRGKPKRRV